MPLLVILLRCQLPGSPWSWERRSRARCRGECTGKVPVTGSQMRKNIWDFHFKPSKKSKQPVAPAFLLLSRRQTCRKKVTKVTKVIRITLKNWGQKKLLRPTVFCAQHDLRVPHCAPSPFSFFAAQLQRLSFFDEFSSYKSLIDMEPNLELDILVDVLIARLLRSSVQRQTRSRQRRWRLDRVMSDHWSIWLMHVNASACFGDAHRWLKYVTLGR